MKHHIAIKFLAIALCALALLAAAGSTAGVIALTATDLYDNNFYDIYESELEGQRNNLAAALAGYHASIELGGCSENLATDYYGGWVNDDDFRSGFWFYTVKDENGIILANTYNGQSDAEVFEIMPYWGSFLCVAAEETEATLPNPKRPIGSDTGRGDEADIETAQATSAQPEPISESFYYEYYDGELGARVSCLLYHAAMPEYTVTLYLLPDAYAMDQEWTLLELLWQIRYNLFGVLGVSLLIFAILAVYLCCAAGRRPGSKEVLPAGLNAMPLDRGCGPLADGLCGHRSVPLPLPGKSGGGYPGAGHLLLCDLSDIGWLLLCLCRPVQDAWRLLVAPQPHRSCDHQELRRGALGLALACTDRAAAAADVAVDPHRRKLWAAADRQCHHRRWHR